MILPSLFGLGVSGTRGETRSRAVEIAKRRQFCWQTRFRSVSLAAVLRLQPRPSGFWQAMTGQPWLRPKDRRLPKVLPPFSPPLSHYLYLSGKTKYILYKHKMIRLQDSEYE